MLSVLCMIRVSEKGARRPFIPQKIPEGPQRARHCSLLNVGIVSYASERQTLKDVSKYKIDCWRAVCSKRKIRD